MRCFNATLTNGNILSLWPEILVPTKVNGPNSVTDLDREPIFEWYAVRCGFKNGAQKYICLNDIGLHVQNMITILGLIINIILFYFGGRAIWPFNEHENLHFDHEKDINMSSRSYEESGYSLDLDLLTSSY